MAEMRASPVRVPGLKTLADIVRMVEERGQMEILPFNPATLFPVSSTTLENLAYGNLPMAIPSQSNIPITKTGRKQEVAELAGLGMMAPSAGRGVAQSANYLGDVLTQAVTRNPQATSMRALEEIARMSPVPQIAPKPPQMPMTPPKSDIGFYSQLEAATIPLQNKGTGDQYLAQIQKSAGVKPEEIQWTGLNEFLTGKPSVTKQEIQDYLQANRVDVREVRLEKTPETIAAERTAAANLFARGEITLEQRNAIFESIGTTNTRHHLGAYQGIKTEIPGGENYREILLTLPEQKSPYGKFLDYVGEKYGRGTPRSQWAAEDNATYERLVVQQTAAGDPNFRSTHFDQPNILAHMRVNDRVVDGKKTLFIEEIQSDWHQAGRKKGYGPQTETTHEAYYTTPDGRRVSLGFGKTQEEAAAAVDPGWQGVVDIKFDTQTKKVGEGVPDAPFKTSWHELTLKRAIQEASEKGYDQIAFTTGKTQAERYDLSKQISQIKYNPPGSEQANKYGTVLKAYDKTGNEVINKSVTPEELPDYIGKEIADRLLKSDESYTGVRSLSGIDLQVGGEGMQGFYDNILPKSLEKLGKKFDAKVGKTEMDGVEVWQMDITPKMRESVTTKGQPLFAIPTVGAAALGASMYDQDPLEQFLNYQ